jgi:hypothetical protein
MFEKYIDSVGEIDFKQKHNLHNFYLYVLVLYSVSCQFSPTQTILFKHSRKFEEVRKFVLEKLSYTFVFDVNK